MSGVVHDVEGDQGLKTFWCPGCECGHYFRAAPSPSDSPFAGNAIWTWDGNREAPTVSPSILVQYDGSDAGIDGAPPKRCHFFLRAGTIEYLSDCTHALAGQTVLMEEW